VQVVRSAGICPSCQGLCLDPARVEEQERRQQQRARSVFDDTGTVFSYPLVDPMAFLLMAAIVGAVNVVKPIVSTTHAAIFSQGLLMAYSFSAMSRVANGA
jgi:hypothetical protein